MADFCNQCSKAIFDEEIGDLAGITTPEQEARDLYAVVICEGCGIIQVDAKGNCVSPDCLEAHGTHGQD